MNIEITIARRGPDDYAYISGTDGLWDHLRDGTVKKLAQRRQDGFSHTLAISLVEKAISSWKQVDFLTKTKNSIMYVDDITCVTGLF